MLGALVVVSGTGTGIGKTHLTEALLLALRARGRRAVAFKPIETGFDPTDAESDSARLDRASSFHVKHPGQRFVPPVSPHLAARLAHEPIRVHDLAEQARDLRTDTDVVLVELAGGLFSPLSPDTVNADFARLLDPCSLILVAPDRLGVLHGVIATTRAARAAQLGIDALVLSAPPTADASTTSNAAELAHFTGIPTIATLPRGPAASLATGSDVQRLCDVLLVP